MSESKLGGKVRPAEQSSGGESQPPLGTSKKIWLEDIGRYGNVRCAVCNDQFPADEGECGVCFEVACMEKDAASRARKTGGVHVYLAPFVARNVETGVVSMCADEPTVKSDDAFMAVVRCFEEKALEDPKADATVPVPLLEGMIQEYMKISAKQQTLSTLSDPMRSPEFQYTFKLLALGSFLNSADNFPSGVGASAMLGKSDQVPVGGHIVNRWRVRKRVRKRTSFNRSRRRKRSVSWNRVSNYI